MKRIDTALRTTVAFGALIAAATAAQAQSNLPPPAVVTNQAPPAEPGTSAKGPPGQDIVITGSRIRHNPLDQAAPVTFVDQQDIQKTGLNSIADVLQRLPSAGGGLNAKFNSSGNFGNPPNGGGVGAGAAEIDLRYLGSNRTLVLVDGLRFVNGASASGVPGSVDLNAIPESMIDRVEVLQDGASAIYGSDAIAGVVNIITKRHQRGFIGQAQLGTYTEGDGGSKNFQLSWGNSESSPTEIVVGGNFVTQEPIASGDRTISSFPIPYATSCLAGGCSSATPLGRFIVLGQSLTLTHPVTGRPVYPTDFKPFTTADRFDFEPYNYILTPLKRYGAFAHFKQEIGGAANFNAKLVYNRRESKNQAAPLPLFIGPDAGNGNLLDLVTVDATNPYNPFGVTLDASNYNFIGRRMVENGPRRYRQTVDTLYGTGTFDGKFGLFGHDWYWDVNGLYGNNKAKQTMLGNLNAAHVQQALGPVAACTSPCVPFNIFGGVGSITPAMLNWIGFVQHDSSQQRLWGATANTSGGIFDLPGGPLSLALGAEHRNYWGRFDPDPVVAAGLGSDIPALPTKGSYNVDEAYGELNAPILSHTPGADLLELDGAVRFSHYSRSGSTTTFKGGVNYKPMHDLRLRGTYSQGFRAPSIGELFGTPSRFDQVLADPCSADQNPSGTILANCIAQGVPPGYQQNNPQISVITGGNQALTPEKSRGWNFGGVYSPGYIPRLTLEADYYKIKIRGAISSPDAAVTLSRCVVNNDATACALVHRTASGAITNIFGLLENIAGIKTDGLDLNASYRTARASWGSLGFTFNNSFLFHFDESAPTATGIAVIHRAGTERGSPDQAYPKHKAIAILDWNGNVTGASLTERYISKVTEYPNGPAAPGDRLSSRLYTDLQFRWTVPSVHEFGFALGVNNLFDKYPPACFSCSLNGYDPTTYDVPGRYVYARASVKY